MTPLTIRYNNPGALEYQPWMAKYGASLGENGRYAAFPSPDAGYQVMGKVLDTYQNKHGLNTVSGIVNRWAPANVDNNSTGTYTQKVAAAIGVDPNTPLTAEQRPALMQAMASYEAGRAAPKPGMAGPASAPGPAPGSFRAAQETPRQETPTMQPMGFMPQLDPGMMQGQMPQQGGFGGYLQGVVNNPLFMMGAGVLGGQNVGQGLMGGMQMANAMQQQALERAMKERQFAETQRMHDQQLRLQQQTEARNAQMTPYQIDLLKTQASEAQGKADLSKQERDLQQRFMDAAKAYASGGQPPAAATVPPSPAMAPGGGLSAAAGIPPMPQGGVAPPMPAPAAAAAQASPQQPGVMTQYGMLPVDMAETAALRAAASGKGELGKMVQEKVDEARNAGQSKKYRDTADAVTADAVAKAKLELPQAETAAQQLKDQIKLIREHKGRAGATGFYGVIPSNMMKPNSEAGDFALNFDELLSKNYLEGMQMIRGTGPVSEKEGAAIAKSISSVSRRMSDKGFDDALNRLEKHVDDALTNTRKRAGITGGSVTQQTPTAAAPAAGASFRWNPQTSQLEKM